MDRQRKIDTRRQGSKPHRFVWWQLMGVLLLSAGIWLFVPQKSFAQAELQASVPKADALLRVAPRQVHLWMSERLSPMLGRVIVVNERNQEVEVGASRVVGKGARELEVGLPSSLPPGSYVVAWYAASEEDGQVTDGTFHFTVLLPDGRMPSLQSATIPGFTAASRSSSADLFDGSTLLLVGATIIMVLGAVFWTGAALWRGLIFPLEELDSSLDLVGALHRRFEQWWALPTLALLLLGTLAWIIAHLMTLGGGIGSSFFSMFVSSVLGETAGHVWIGQVLFLLLAVRLSVFRARQSGCSPRLTTLLVWVDLFVGLGFFVLLALSNQAGAATSGQGVMSVLFAWLHLLAAAFWVGGILFLASCCLPLLHQEDWDVQAHFFVTLFPASFPWLLSGAVLMIVIDPLQATRHIQQWSELFTTSYGAVFVSKMLLEGVLLLMSGIVMKGLLPGFQQTWEKYCAMRQQISKPVQSKQRPEEPLRLVAQTLTSQEILLAHQIQRMKRFIGIGAGIGLGMLICAGLLTVLATLLS